MTMKNITTGVIAGVVVGATVGMMAGGRSARNRQVKKGVARAIKTVGTVIDSFS